MHQACSTDGLRNMQNSLFVPMAFHVLWTFGLYGVLTVLRAPKIWGVDTASGLIAKWAAAEPRVSANLSNQFEWPLFFYVACLWAAAAQTVSQEFVILAWIFIAGRVIHSFVQIFTSNIRLRGLVFTINFLAVLGMWGLLFIQGFN